MQVLFKKKLTEKKGFWMKLKKKEAGSESQMNAFYSYIMATKLHSDLHSDVF